MRTIWKFPLAFGPVTQHEVPSGAVPITVGLDPAADRGLRPGQVPDPVIAVWFDCPDHEAPTEHRWFTIVGTGHPVPPGEVLGSVFDGPFVWHVVEVTND